MKNFSILVTLLFSLKAFSCLEGDGFLPENNLSIPIEKTANLTQAQFEEVIQQVVDIYDPIFKEKGLRLQSFPNWRSTQVNARADRRGRVRRIIMFGGLGRHELVNADELSLITCHEIGHHLGGAPKASNWASGEGQADYFSTMKCLRKLFLKFPKELDMNKVPVNIQNSCRENFKAEADIQVCMRSSLTGLNVANLFATLNGTIAPDPTSIDENEARRTNHRHPAPQCRFDTYFNGAICPVDHEVEFSNRDAAIGACHNLNGNSQGMRPRCWYKPSN